MKYKSGCGFVDADKADSFDDSTTEEFEPEANTLKRRYEGAKDIM
jgi:hypothetical protein